MDFFEFYKELYHKENDRRQEVLNALNIPIAVITATSTANYLFITTFDYTFNKILDWIFIAIVIATFILLIVSIFYLIKAFCDFNRGYEYKGLPYPGELHNWHKDLKEYHSTYDIASENVDQMVKDEILKKILTSTDHNTYVNDKKHEYIYNSKKFLVGSLVITLITLLPFGFDYFNKKEEIYKVTVLQKDLIIDLKPNKMSNKPVPPPPPPPPRERLIKEGQEPPKPKQSK